MIKKSIILASTALLIAGSALLTDSVTSAYAQQTDTPKTIVLEQKIEKSFPNKKISEIENFEQYYDDILKIVGEEMGYTMDDKIPLPEVIRSDEITLEEYSKLFGIPVKAMCSVYFPEENIAVIAVDKKPDSLAHEFTHYFQIQYGHEDYKNDPSDMLEFEALAIQDWFKDKYLK